MVNGKQGERVAVYIDGSNFYKYLKDKEVSFPKGVKFDFVRFVNNLAGDRHLVSKRYYIGIARNIDDTEKSKSIVKGQQKFLSRLENEGFSIKRGRVMYDSGRIREKGTDVKIAVDLVIGAADDLYDTAIVVSSDTDLIPAVQYVKYKGKRIEYVGFSHAPSLGMQKHVDFSVLLTPQDISNLKD
ncbi:MAG: NYN domain-containing protein [Candidatus Wildermuthbacteria bacterium]|nr:NYN domain-containing protein [Candidatus Wildermuthbacteria bacterium]